MALVVYLNEYKNKDDEPMWALSYRKKMAAFFTPQQILQLRNIVMKPLHADRALVFTDTRQSQHLQQAWLITRKAGYVPDSFN